jgi:hypothetical protein
MYVLRHASGACFWLNVEWAMGARGALSADLVVQLVGGVREEVPMLVNRAALSRHAVPDRSEGLLEPRRP